MTAKALCGALALGAVIAGGVIWWPHSDPAPKLIAAPDPDCSVCTARHNGMLRRRQTLESRN